LSHDDSKVCAGFGISISIVTALVIFSTKKIVKRKIQKLIFCFFIFGPLIKFGLASPPVMNAAS
jgi:hypothetical protein